MKDSQQVRPLLVGFIGAVAAPALGMLVFTLIATRSLPTSAVDWWSIGLLLLLAVGFSLIGVLALGAPYIFWLRRNGRLSWLSVVSGAAAAGAIYFGAVSLVLSWGNQLPKISDLWLGVVLGALSGIGFCIGAGPNISFKPTSLRDAA